MGGISPRTVTGAAAPWAAGGEVVLVVVVALPWRGRRLES